MLSIQCKMYHFARHLAHHLFCLSSSCIIRNVKTLLSRSASCSFLFLGCYSVVLMSHVLSFDLVVWTGMGYVAYLVTQLKPYFFYFILLIGSFHSNPNSHTHFDLIVIYTFYQIFHSHFHGQIWTLCSKFQVSRFFKWRLSLLCYISSHIVSETYVLRGLTF